MVVFKLLWTILIIDELSTVRTVAVISAIILGVLLCRLLTAKNVLLTGLVVFFLNALGIILLFDGKIAGWALLSFNLPFFISFAITVGLYYLTKAVILQSRNAKEGLEQNQESTD